MAYNYRQLYKELRKYFEFSFKLPQHKKDFSPQQKSAITRKYTKIYPYIDGNFKPDLTEITYLKYPKTSTGFNRLKGVDGIRTDFGLFYKWPQAQLKKSKIEKNRWLVVVNPKIKKGQRLVQKRRDIFFPFPDSIKGDINRIQSYVERLKEKYHPHDIMWAVHGQRERTRYEPELFDLYFSNSYLKETDEQILNSEDYEDMDSVERSDLWKRRKMRKKVDDDYNFYIGVFFIYYLTVKTK